MVMVRRRHVVAATAVTALGFAAAHHSAPQRPTLHAAPVRPVKHSAVRDALAIRVSPRPVETPASRSETRTAPPPAPTQPAAEVPGGDVLEVTAYCWTGNRTASGVWPEKGMAAGNDWPFGTRLRVEGVGVVTVTDRYGYGTQLDIFLGHYAGCEHDALIFGRRHLHVEVLP